MVQDRDGYDVGRKTSPDLYRPRLPYRAPEAVARPRSTSDAGLGMAVGIPYTAPTAGAGAGDERPVTTGGLVWRIVASIVLVALGVNALVRAVPLLQTANSDPASAAWVSALALLVIAALFLAYPVVNLVRWVHASRTRRS
jgi:hypothetical protein